ncbi:MAG: EAL domain-containing protein [Acidiferrobacterales bacterium]
MSRHGNPQATTPAAKRKNAERLLVVDDEPAICSFMKEVAEDLGLEVQVATHAKEFLQAYRAFAPTIIILDLRMPDTDGIQVLRFLANDKCRAKVVVASGVDRKVLVAAKRLGDAHGLHMAGVLAKPILLSELEALLQKLSHVQQAPTAEGLRQAIEKGQLVVYYQPKLSLRGEEGPTIESVEALVRWDHPRDGLLPPKEFIPLAEKTGLISGLTDHVVRTVVKQLAQWRHDDLPISVAVNLAPQLLSQLELPDRIAQMLEEHEVPGSKLVLEITEQAARTDAAQTMDILSRFRLNGIALSLDDFGSGYSSLVELSRMPFNEINIDRSLVIGIEQNEDAKTIVRSIVDLAHNLRLTVCAEGTETQEAVNFLYTLGCDRVQGFYISEAIPPTELTPLLRTSNWAWLQRKAG